MFAGRLLLLTRTTVTLTAGVVVFATTHSQCTGNETDAKSRGRGSPLLANRIDRFETLEQYKRYSSKVDELSAISVLSKMDYKEEADKIAQSAYNIYKSTDWKLAKASTENKNIEYFEKDVKVLYKKSSEFDGHIYRAECIIDSPAEKVIKYILPSPRGLRGKWDKTVKESEVLEKIEEDLIVGRSATHSVAMGLISSRDFVDLITVRRYPEEKIVCTNSRSIQRKDCPPKDGFVRGLNYHGGTFCIPVEGDPNRCHVVNIVQTDLSGMLPKSVVESALPTNLIDFFRDLDAALKDNMNGF